MLAAVVLVLQTQRSDFLLVFHPPQAPCKFSSTSSSSTLLSSPPSLSFSTLDSRPFHPPASHLAWKTRPAPLTHSTDLSHFLSHVVAQSIFLCVCFCVFVSVFLTLFGLFLLCLSLFSLYCTLCLLWDLRTLSVSPSGAVSGGQKGAATGHGDDGGGPYRSDSVKSMVTEGVKAGRWQTVQGHMQSGGLRPSE